MKSKKSFVKIIVMAIMLIILLQVSVNAVIVSTDKQVDTGNNVIVSITSKQALGAYTIKLTSAGGLTLLSALGEQVSSDNMTISGSSSSGITSLGSYTFSTPNVSTDTVCNVKFSITGMETPKLKGLSDETNTAVVTVKAPSNNDSEPTVEPNPSTPTEPTFTSANKTMYATGDINLRASWSTSSDKTGITKGTELKVTGTSTEKINGYVWYRVEYNGQTKYVASSLITSTKPEEKNNENTEVTNNISSEVTNELTNTEVAPTTDTKIGLSKLQIKDVDLTNVFKTTKYEYKFNVRELNKLTIEKLETNEDKATIEVVGNDDFVEGENIVNIIVKSEDGTRIATYQLTVNKLKTQEESIISKLGTTNIVVIGVIAFAVLVGIIIIIVRFVRSRREEDYDENGDYYYQERLPEKENNSNQEINENENENENTNEGNFDQFGNFNMNINNIEEEENVENVEDVEDSENYEEDENLENEEESDDESQSEIEQDVPKIEYTSNIPEEFYEEEDRPKRKKGKHF